MRKSEFWKLAPPILLIIAVALAIPSIAMQGDTVADRELGQFDFSHNGIGLIDARGLGNPSSVAIDTSAVPNRLYVADENNSRVLGYKDVTSFVNGNAADLVIGQPDFLSAGCPIGGVSAGRVCDPVSVAVDGGGNLYVADKFNQRVLEYDTPFFVCGGSFPCVGGGANRVFGQGGSFTTSTVNKGGVSANSLNFPSGVAVDSGGNLYVADTDNNRVLEYNTPLSTDTTADNVFGQGGSFTTNTANNGGVSANSLDFPFGVAVDGSGDLYIADSDNRRVLEYNTPLSTDTTADTVFGQGGSFTTNASNNGGVSANSLSFPSAVLVDGGGNLYIADSFNSRVLEYDTPLTTDTTADNVFGQGGSFTTNTQNNGGVSANSLGSPSGAAVDSRGNLYVADVSNQRVLEYDTPLTTDTIADTVLGQLDFSHNGGNLIDARGLYNPSSVAIDTSALPNRLYVADSNNSRVLGYKDVTSFVNGNAADLEIGQPDILSAGCENGGVSANSLCIPAGLAVDGAGNLYVADQFNNRVLEYDTPFSVCGGSFPCVGSGANRVFGQGGSFTTSTLNKGGVSANSLDFPSGVAVDRGGNLYVADSDNNRVLEYNTPLTTDTTADTVFGQLLGSFATNTANIGGHVSFAGLDFPSGVTVDGTGNLYVADTDNNRVLEYNTPLTTNTAPDTVFGQGGSFNTNTSNNGGVSANSLDHPLAVAVDGGGNLYVADDDNNRVLEYNMPLTTNTTADTVFGQGSTFTTNTPNNGGVSANSLDAPAGVAVDGGGNLYVADFNNSRVLEYDNPQATATATPTATATATPTGTAPATATETATATATHTATATNTATATATAAEKATSTATATATPTSTPTTSISVLASLAMGNAPVGNTATKNLTVKNTGTNPLFIGSVTSNDPEFAATGATTCPAGGLAPLGTCRIAIGFTPSALGARSATLQVNDNTATSPQPVKLSGTGTIDMTVTPASVSIGSVKDGSKIVKVVTVSNKQGIPVSLSEGFSGSNSGDFSITGGTCTSTLAAKSNCSLQVAFVPTSVGSESATMTVTDSPDPLGPYMVAFNAAATIPESLSATKLIFGNVYQTASKTLSITVTNKATSGPITLTGASINGANVGDFSLAGGTCTGTLSASSNCTYAVTFTPSTETAESAALSIGVAEAPNGGPSAVGLTGTGLTPIKLSPAVSLSFNSFGSPQLFVSRTLTVYNYGGRTVSLSETITGTDAIDFAVTGGSCGTILESGGSSCTYQVRFTASGSGTKSATLGVSAVGDAASPHNVSLIKPGATPTATPTITATPLATVTATPTVTATGTPAPTPNGTPNS